jgi:hypothetical protein
LAERASVAHDPPAAFAALESPDMDNTLRLAVIGLGLAPLAAPAADRIAARPGLWEFTHQNSNTGAPPIPAEVLAKLPPDTLAKMQAQMQHPATVSNRSCITAQDLDRGFNPDDRPNSRCKNTVLSHSSTALEIAIDCADLGKEHGSGHGTAKFQTAGPEAMTGTIDMTIKVGEQTMTHHSQVSGRWLGADCGDVKPARQQD